MKQKAIIGGLILVIAVLSVTIVFMAMDKNSSAPGNDVTSLNNKNNPQSKNENKLPQKVAHISFNREINGKWHTIYDGKDLGEEAKIPASQDSATYTKIISGKTHVIHNGEDYGEVRVGQDVEYALSGNNIALEREVNGRTHVFYNKKDMGEGHEPVLGENSIAFLKAVGNTEHVIYNGKDMGAGDEVLGVTDNDVFYKKIDENTGDSYAYRNSLSLGMIHGSGGFWYADGNYAFTDPSMNLIYNNQNLGSIKIFGNSGGFAELSKNHIIFTRDVSGKTHIIYDGKDLGEGVNPSISGDNIAYNIEANGKQHILFNGKDMGEGTRPQLLDDNLAFLLEVQGKKHVIYNGKDMGECSEKNSCMVTLSY